MSADKSSLAGRWSESLALTGGQGPEWLEAVRARGAEAFKEAGLPDRKVENWRYTPLHVLEQQNPELGVGARVPENTAAEPTRNRPSPLLSGIPTLDIVDGKVGAELPAELLSELPRGVRLLSLHQAVSSAESVLRPVLENSRFAGRGKAFQALNTAQLEQGLVIHVPESVDAGSLMLRWFGSSENEVFNQFRLVLALEKGARLNVLQQFGDDGDEPQLLNLVTQVSLAAEAELERVVLQTESAQSIVFNSTNVWQQAGSRYAHYGFDLGGGLARHDTEVELQGAGASVSLNGAFVMYGQRHADNYLSIHHDARDCRSEQFYRGVLGGRSRAVFNGRTLIREGADGSSVEQSNANLLLSRHAEIDTKPELEIYADEVEASHGATVGQLDESAVFYLRTRGLDESQARRMLTAAFCRAVTDRISNRELAEAISARVDQAMSRIEENPQ